jgi:hypothetical protein
VTVGLLLCRGYIEMLASSPAANVGICKIIPPAGWFSRDYDIQAMNVRIPTPIKQCVVGGTGVYEVQLFEQKPMTAAQMAQFAETNVYYEDDFSVREKKFWRTIGSNGYWADPIYGADVQGTLFGESDASGWNLNKLDSILTDIGSVIPGVNCGYLYFGCWRSMFAYHTEDYDLFSVNYVHHGASKSWYSIPPSSRKKFEIMADSYFGHDANVCKEYLRHKTKMFSPNKLKEHTVPYTTVLQQAGEFVVTFPGSYHAGFNHGFNIAEATNFASSTWFDIGRKAKHCVCRPNAVKLDIDHLETAFLRKLNAAHKELHNNELLAPTGRLRCCCLKPATRKSDDTVNCISCLLCRLHFHLKCRDKLLDSLSLLDQFSAQQEVCHMCALFETDRTASADGAAVPADISKEEDDVEYDAVRCTVIVDIYSTRGKPAAT